VNYDRQGGGYGAEYSKALEQEPGSFGWQTRVIEGDRPQQQASIAYRGNWSVMQARVNRIDKQVSGTAEVDGAIVGSGGGIFFANQIYDSFAMVDVGVPGVDVMVDNRRAAVSGPDGRALVTNLRSYESAKISIDPTNLPVDAIVSTTSQRVTPVNGGGVDVKVDVHSTSHSALVVFRDVDGAPLPVGSHGWIAGQTDQFLIGYDGQAYVPNLAASNRAVVKAANGECRASFGFTPDASSQTVIDPVVCR
jgi:outer membrane usher protein